MPATVKPPTTIRTHRTIFTRAPPSASNQHTRSSPPVKLRFALEVNVHVRLFARYRELAGSALLDLDVPPSSTALDVFDRVAERFPDMRPMRASTLMAVDAEYIRPDTQLRDSEELALMPPVSGGSSADG